MREAGRAEIADIPREEVNINSVWKENLDMTEMSKIVHWGEKRREGSIEGSLVAVFYDDPSLGGNVQFRGFKSLSGWGKFVRTFEEAESLVDEWIRRRGMDSPDKVYSDLFGNPESQKS